jgi:dTDP-4-amino-4,6-dideoxygalactose transaminase
VIDPDSFGMSRDELAIALDAENIDTRKYYAPPAHRQTAYRSYDLSDGLLRNTDMLAARSLSLPMWSHMETEVAMSICRAVRRIHNFAEDVKMSLRPKVAAGV